MYGTVRTGTSAHMNIMTKMNKTNCNLPYGWDTVRRFSFWKSLHGTRYVGTIPFVLKGDGSYFFYVFCAIFLVKNKPMGFIYI